MATRLLKIRCYDSGSLERKIRRKFFPTVLGKTLQILLGKDGLVVEGSFARCSSSPSPRSGTVSALSLPPLLRLLCILLPFLPLKSLARLSGPAASCESRKNKAYPETAAEQERRARREEENPAEDEAAGGKMSQRGASTRTSSPSKPRNPRRTRLEQGTRVSPAKLNN